MYRFIILLLLVAATGDSYAQQAKCYTQSENDRVTGKKIHTFRITPPLSALKAHFTLKDEPPEFFIESWVARVGPEAELANRPLVFSFQNGDIFYPEVDDVDVIMRESMDEVPGMRKHTIIRVRITEKLVSKLKNNKLRYIRMAYDHDRYNMTVKIYKAGAVQKFAACAL